MSKLVAGEVRLYTIQTGDRERVRIAAREIIGALIDCPPSEVAFEYTSKGKPLLRNDQRLHFSISHAGDWSMVALTYVAPIGVDIEVVRAVPKAEAILRRFFSEAEMQSVLSDDHREFRFARAWTQAEATVKVRGASVWEIATPDPSVITREVTAPEGYVATVAVSAPEWTLTQYPSDLTSNG